MPILAITIVAILSVATCNSNSKLRQDVDVLEQDVSVLKQDMATIKRDIAEMRELISRIDYRLDTCC